MSSTTTATPKASATPVSPYSIQFVKEALPPDDRTGIGHGGSCIIGATANFAVSPRESTTLTETVLLPPYVSVVLTTRP